MYIQGRSINIPLPEVASLKRSLQKGVDNGRIVVLLGKKFKDKLRAHAKKTGHTITYVVKAALEELIP